MFFIEKKKDIFPTTPSPPSFSLPHPFLSPSLSPPPPPPPTSPSLYSDCIRHFHIHLSKKCVEDTVKQQGPTIPRPTINHTSHSPDQPSTRPTINQTSHSPDRPSTRPTIPRPTIHQTSHSPDQPSTIHQTNHPPYQPSSGPIIH